MRLILKAKPAAQGEIRTWADQRQHKKVGHKWVEVSRERQAAAHESEIASRYYNQSLSSNLGGVVDQVLRSFGIKDYQGLRQTIAEGTFDTAHKIFRKVKDSVDQQTASTGEKKAAVDMIGRAIIAIREQHAQKPKVKLTVRHVSRKGKIYYERPPEAPKLPVLKPTEIKGAQGKLAGWNVSQEPTSEHIKGMISSGSAKLLEGKIKANKPWSLEQGLTDVIVPWKPDAKGIRVRMKQVRQVKQRTRRTALVEATIPYAVAKAFLTAHVKSKRTRNNLVGQLERSQGYRAYMERAAA